MESKKNSTVVMRTTVAIVFILFTYLYLSCFQADILAVAQHVLSAGKTHYYYTMAPIVITGALFVLQRFVFTFVRLTRKSHALTYFPSFLLLALLTNIPMDIDQTHVWCASWWWAPLLLLLWGVVVWIYYHIEPLSQPLHDDGVLSRLMGCNLALMLGMMLLTIFLSNNDRVFHQRMKMERLMQQGKYAEALHVGSKSLATDSSLTMLRLAAMHKCQSMGERMFNYPLEGGSKAMAPDGKTVKALMWQAPKWMKKPAWDGKHGYRVPTDYKLCRMLLDKNLDQFANELRRMGADSIKLPRHFKEALILYAHRRTHPVIVYKNDVMEADFQDYQTLENKYSNPQQRQTALRDTYGNTYWYYFQYGEK